MADFTIVSVIICDDIRTEQNGKHILIGVYGGDIVVSELPVTLPLAFWIEFLPKRAGEFRFDLRMEVPGSAPSLELNGIGATTTNLDPGSMVLAPRPYVIQAEGRLQLQLRSSSVGRWKTFKAKQIMRGPAAAAPSSG